MPPKKRPNDTTEHADFRITRMSVSAEISDVTRRIARLLLADIPSTRRCPFGCGALLLSSEVSTATTSWCCNGFTQRHTPWRTHPPELTALLDSPSFGALSRIVNNTRCSCGGSSWSTSNASAARRTCRSRFWVT